MAGSVDSAPDARVFLTARWRDVVMLNYEVDGALLTGYSPRGCEVDSFGGRTLVSLVGFRFLRTRMFGAVRVPFHSNFLEVNLRFYVRRRDDSAGGVRRGVVFLREIVPRHAVAGIARFAYNENYCCCTMRHRLEENGAGMSAAYQWRAGGEWLGFEAQARGAPALPVEGSIEQFVCEHYWGYSRQRDGGTVEYHVAHPPWRVRQSESAWFAGDAGTIYGAAFGEVLVRKPDSAFIAEGSEVTVFAGKRIA